MLTKTGQSQSRQGIPPNRKSDAGPIPDKMIGDLRRLLWSMENVTLYWALGMGLVIGSLFIVGIIFFATANIAPAQRSSRATGAVALTVLAAMTYAPFLNRWFEDRLEAQWLREALYPQTLENLAHFMAVCRMGSRKRVANRLLAIWKKHHLEPGWSAHPMDPPHMFK